MKVKELKRDILLLLIVSSGVFLFNLGAGSLSSWDEAFYAQVSREILQTNNWIDLSWGGFPWSDKPPLYMWATAVFYRLFGINEFSVRFFSALSGIATVIITYLLAGRLFSRRTGLISGIMLAGTYHFVWLGKMGSLDVTFTLFVFLSIFFFTLAEEKRSSIIYSFLFFGLAFLTKGPGALLVPMILGLYVLLRRRWDIAFNRYTAIGVLVFLVITGSWYFPAALHYGKAFVKGHFLDHLITRATSTMDGHHGDWLAYINAVLYKGKPWGTFGLLSFPFFVFFTFKEKMCKNFILVVWITVVFLVFGMVRTKLHWYIIPVYPAVIIVAGWAVERLLKRRALVFIAAVFLLTVSIYFPRKGIYTLDFNHDVKDFSGRVMAGVEPGQQVYLYNIQDPGMMFYFGEKGRYIQKREELETVQKSRNGAIVITRADESDLVKGDVFVPGRESGYAAVKVK
ncbi:MAG: glycosyltransferase family 39 protein [Candidatus Omnitrophota bacterium]|nr:glycosyltransferase family 39 protein [Candidatus Omnitrophota bacterium]